MIFQGQNLAFEMSIAIPMFISWIILMAVSFYFIFKGKLSKKVSIGLYLISIILGGIILGAVPNAVMPIQQIFDSLGSAIPMNLILPMLIILALLLLTTIFIGRIFCGFACPVGALEELISKINFKSSLKEQKNIKYKIDVSQRTTNIIRWAFFGIILILALVWSISLLQIINPFLGFSFIKNPAAVALTIPLVVLIGVSIASIFLYRPWCRFLCPFGAIASLTSRFSQYKYVRTEDCNNCGLCEKICPTKEAYQDSKKAECYFCGRCVEICPQNAIILKRKEK